jgi:hypothetical protein
MQLIAIQFQAFCHQDDTYVVFSPQRVPETARAAASALAALVRADLIG